MGNILAKLRARNGQDNSSNQQQPPQQPATTQPSQPSSGGQAASAGQTDPPAPEQKAADPPKDEAPAKPATEAPPEQKDPEPAQQPPAEEPPATQAPPEQPAAEEPPAEAPPAENPPAEEPAAEEPAPQEQPPAQPDPEPAQPEPAQPAEPEPQPDPQPEPAAPAEPEPAPVEPEPQPEPQPEPEPAPVADPVEPAVEVDAGPVIAVRKEIRAMSPEEQDRFFNAVDKMMENKDGPGTSEWFRIAGYHGKPGNEYCAHGTEIFPGWHRIYLLEFQNGLQAADRALGNDGNIGLPYWDWTVDTAAGLPSIIRERFPKFPDDMFPANNSERWPVINRNSDRQIYSNMRRSRIVQRANDCLLATQHWAHASTAHSRQSRYPSLETPHNSVHVAVGSPMNSVAFAAFDVCFWLHHCNIDRIYEGYLALEPDSAQEFEAFQNNRRRDLFDETFEPFTKPDGSKYSPKDTFSTSDLGYVYAEVPTVDAQAMQVVPTYAIFEQIRIIEMQGACYFLHVFAVPKDAADDFKAPENPDDYDDVPGYAGFEVIFGKGPGCEACAVRPPYDLRVDITEALAQQNLSRYDAVLKVMTVETTADNAVRPLEETPVPPPVIDGPLFDDRQAPLEEATKDAARPEDVRALQEYLAQFGYYGDAVDGDFGPVTDKAVRYYQQLAGLTVDGQVGPVTKKQILNATRLDWEKDVEEGATVANAAELEFSQPRDKGPFYNKQKEISYSVGVTPGYLPRDGVLEALVGVFGQYGEAAGLTFTLTADEQKSDIKIGWSDEVDGKKAVRFDGAGGVLARAGEGFVQFDEAERWTLNPDEAGNLEDRSTWRRGDPVVLFQHVALHEVGHALGLGHSNDMNDVMGPYYNPGLIVLTDNDKARIAAIYAEEEA